MRIARVSTRIVNAEMRNWVFVRVDTDVDLHGWGEAGGCYELYSHYALKIQAIAFRVDAGDAGVGAAGG
jgi:L-alanine-DL-glutamate epimerase-like enolase superfamily enzyme